MASLIEQAGSYCVKFRYGGRQFMKSLKTRDRDLAEAGVKHVEITLTKLKRGQTAIPPGADVGEFIVSGGERTSKISEAAVKEGPVTLKTLFDRWKAAQRKRENTLRTILIHRDHVFDLLGETTEVNTIKLGHLRTYCDQRSKEPGKRGTVRPYTIRKELKTFRQVWVWGAQHGIVDPPTWSMDNLEFDKDPGREPFRTYEAIERRIKRGGLERLTVA